MAFSTRAISAIFKGEFYAGLGAYPEHFHIFAQGIEAYSLKDMNVGPAALVVAVSPEEFVGLTLYPYVVEEDITALLNGAHNVHLVVDIPAFKFLGRLGVLSNGNINIMAAIVISGKID